MFNVDEIDKCHLGPWGRMGSKISQKSVTYYLNRPLMNILLVPHKNVLHSGNYLDAKFRSKKAIKIPKCTQRQEEILYKEFCL
jgi:hypothetical protein